MFTERSFNILRKVSANWEEIDKLVSDILSADKNNEVDYIVIGYNSVKDGILCDNFTPIVSGKSIPGYELEEAVSFRTRIEYTRNDMLPKDCLYLYSREDAK